MEGREEKINGRKGKIKKWKKTLLGGKHIKGSAGSKNRRQEKKRKK